MTTLPEKDEMIVEEFDAFLEKYTGKHENTFELAKTLFADTVRVRKDIIVKEFRNILTTKNLEMKQAVEDIIKMADALELECGKDGDKGTKQWMAFKGFRNTIRDKYLTGPLTDNNVG